MKKRLLCLLLAACTLLATVPGMTVDAHADGTPDKVVGYLQNHVLQPGETILGLCAKYNIDFYKNDALIAKVNNIANFSFMMPGKSLWLPVSKAPAAGVPHYTLISHKLAFGETLYGLCQSHGIDYQKSYQLLAALNPNISNPMANQSFILPVYVGKPGPATPVPSITPKPTATPKPTPTATPTPTPAPGTTAAPPTVGPAGGGGLIPGGGGGGAALPGGGMLAGDSIAYYLKQHVLQYGETITGLCAAYGIDFYAKSAEIMKLNGITSYNYMLPGKTLLLPTTQLPSGAYYKIIRHRIVPGDTLFGLCAAYGINYYDSYNLLASLNKNIGLLIAGFDILIPVPAVGGAVPPIGGGGAVPPSIGPGGATPAPSGKPGVPTVAPTVKPIVSGSTAYFLKQHVLQGGETIMGLCNTYKIDFYAKSNEIMRLNNITNFNTLMPGKLLLLPMNDRPASGMYYKVVNHTIVPGDTMYGLCLANGIDYYGTYNLLALLNPNMGFLVAGQNILLPILTSGIGGGTPTATPGPGGTTAAPTAKPGLPTVAPSAKPPVAPTAAPTIIPEGVAYYLRAHTLVAGETVSDICTKYGIDFNANNAMILKINGLANYNGLIAGQTLWLPVNTVPTAPYYKVVCHHIKAGDNVFNLCTANGINYEATLPLITALNRANLTSFQPGDPLLLPIYVAK